MKEDEEMPTVTLEIPDTTFVASALSNTNFSTYPLLLTGTDPSYQNCLGLMQIDLPSLPVASVDSALLQLCVIVKTGAVPSPIVVNRVTVPFNTASVTYDTRPAFTPTPSQIDITQADVLATVQIDVTDLVNSWLSGTYANYGIALANPDGTSVVEFATNGIMYEPFFPKLILTYSVTPVETVDGICFSYAQLAHVIEQIIMMYPANIITVFTRGLVASSVTGTPYQLYASPEGTHGSLFILMDGGQPEAIPLNAITAIYTGAGSVYNPSITYLPTPQFSEGCGTNLITAYHDYLPVTTDVQMYMGSNISASGSVYKNEYGILVLSDADGNTPIFVPVVNVNAVLPAAAAASGKAPQPHVEILKKSGPLSRIIQALRRTPYGNSRRR